MTVRSARVLSHLVFGSVVGFVALWGWLALSYPERAPHPDDAGIGVAVIAMVLALLFSLVGGLIIRRQARNSVGYIFCTLGLVYAGGIALGDYAWISFNRDEWWPFTRAAGYIADVTFQNPSMFGFFVFFFLLFPDGGLPSRRWRPLAFLAAFSIVGLFVNGALRPDLLNPIPIQNPMGVEALEPVREVLDVSSFAGLVIALVGSVASLVVRLRRSRGDERQQIKWFLAAATVLTTLIAIAPVTFFTPSFPVWAWPVALLTGLSLIPIAAGVAILRYRLYEIDVIINRALVYSVLTAILGGSYLGSVVLLQGLLGPITRDSDVAIAGSTLAVAALFRPARTRVQAFIDRRFYRRRYDAAETLDRFSATLRDQLDLHSLSRELVTAVGSTMQPAHVSLWLRSDKEVASV